MIAEKIGGPLVGFTAHEAVEIIEAHAAGPLVEGPGQAVEIGRGVMVFAEPRCSVAVLLQDLPDRGTVLLNDRIIAGVSRGLFRDDAKADRVVIAAGDERCACRRAERSGMELRVAQTRLREAIHRRSRDDAAKSARDAVALIVG